MSIRTLAGTSALVLLMSSAGLLADVTPEEVWQGWQDAITAANNTVTAESATRDGDVLEVSNITIGDEANGSVTFESLSFEDQGDGTVAITTPDSFPVTLHVPPKADDPTSKAAEIVFTVTAPENVVIASGAVGAISYEATAPSLSVLLDTIDGKSAAEQNAAFELKATEISSTYQLTAGEAPTITSKLSAKSINLDARGKDDTDAASGDFKIGLSDLSSTWDITTPKDMGMGDLTMALSKGFALNGSFGFGATSFDINAIDAAGTATQVTGGLASAALGMVINATTFDYSTTSKGAAFKITSPEVPVPDASLTYGEAGFRMVLPVAKSDTPAPFSFLISLVDFAPSEAIWALIDPTKGLNHAPATLIIDTKGQATLTKDLFTDAAALGAGAAEPPGVLNALDITNIDLKALGAEITAMGGFTFDNSDMTTFGGVPAPTGKVDIKAVGLNAVIDTLVKLGLLPEDQAMQGRMVMAMFANTSTTADEITSTLEFKDKHFYANSQQLQ